MSIIQGGIERQSLTSELEIIHQKRAALQRLVKLTSTLTRLHQGLQAVILMGQSASRIPSRIMETFNSLKEKLDKHPTDTLKNTLSKTEIRIQQNIKHVLEISQKSDEVLSQQLNIGNDSLLDKLEENIHEYVGDFKKKTQTSIALRITLKTRKVIMKAFKLPVPQSFIEQQIHTLDIREAHCRKKIKEDMHSLHDDIDLLINNEDCSDDIKQQLLQVEKQLKSNMTHFSEGKHIDKMPILYESIELSAPQDLINETETHNTEAMEVIETPPETEKLSQKKRSFFSRVWEWLTSPANRKWKDIQPYE